MKSKQRHSGGSYRRMKTMIAYHANVGKDRKKKLRSVPKPNEPTITSEQADEISSYIDTLLRQEAKKHGKK